MKRYMFNVGDMIRINRFGYQHVGIYVGRRTADGCDVVHNDKGIGVVLSTLAEFADGQEVFLHKEASGSAYDREMIAQRALALMGQKFDLINFNCEHAANLAQTGEKRSEQVETALAVGGLALILGLAAFALGGASQRQS